jgi:hypothetical protein
LSKQSEKSDIERFGLKLVNKMEEERQYKIIV